MLHILLVTFPFFALVACGYMAVKRQFLPTSAISGLNSFVLYFALPCMLYRFGASTPIASTLNPTIIGTYLIAALLMVGLLIFLARLRGLDWNNASFAALVGTFPNTGYMGVPLLLTLLGDHAVGPVIATILIDLVITSSVCVALSQLSTTHNQSSVSAAWFALKRVAANPMPWAILIGAAASAWNLALPKPAEQTIALLANAASPVALFTIGAVLARAPVAGTQPAPWSDSVVVALIKLLLHPLLIVVIGTAAIYLGAPLSLQALTVLILVAALPSASNVAMLAERFDADSTRIARIILISTVLAFFTFSAMVSLLV